MDPLSKVGDKRLFLDNTLLDGGVKDRSVPSCQWPKRSRGLYYFESRILT